jgi:hypothetical protein
MTDSTTPAARQVSERPSAYRVDDIATYVQEAAEPRQRAQPAAELTHEAIEHIAQRVAQLLRERSEGGNGFPVRMLDAAGLAGRLGVNRAWVYQHKADLGAIRIGRGPNARIRFDLETVEAALTSDATREQPSGYTSSSTSPRKPTYLLGPAVPLLPVTPRRTFAPFDSGTQERIEDR